MYDDIISHAPKQAQKRIRVYVETVEHEETPESLRELYGVADIKELVQHLVEYECGTPYVENDQLISDYRVFWSTLDKMYGEGNYP